MQKLNSPALLLALLISVSAVSCGSSGTKSETTGTSASAETSKIGDTEESRIAMDFTGRDYEGYEFNMLYFDSAAAYGWIGIPCDIACAEETGDLLNDSVYNRNLKIEETLNVKLVAEGISNDAEILTRLQQAMYSGLNEVDAVFPHFLRLNQYMNGQLLTDLNTLDGLDLSMPWFDADSINSLSMEGKLFGVSSSITYIDKLASYGVFYNKSLAEDYKLPDLYAAVDDGSWTYDNMLKMSKDATIDVNNDGVFDEQDSYGISTQNDASYVLLHSTGLRICDKDETGAVVLTLKNEKAVNLLESVYTLLADRQQIFNMEYFKQLKVSDVVMMFNDDRVLFLLRPIQSVMMLRNMNADFGILPIPKYYENQERYCSTINYYAANFTAVPAVVKDEALVSDVLSMLAWESYYSVIDPLYNLILDDKLMRDERSNEMIDIILENRIYDIGNISDFGGIAKTLLTNHAGTVSSWIASSEAAVSEDIKRLTDLLNS